MNMLDYDDCKDYTDLDDIAYGHGWAFGKYATQVQIDEKLLSFLSNNPTALKLYQDNYNLGFNAGLAENGLFVSSCF